MQNITLEAIGSNSKQPGTGSLIQDMTDSGLKSYIVNNSKWHWEPASEQIHMHFWSQLLCFSSTCSILIAVLKSEEPFYNSSVVQISQSFKVNVLSNLCFQSKTVDEKIIKHEPEISK